MNLEAARAARDRGLSYAETAQIQNVSPTAIYYALNPGARAKWTPQRRQRTVVTSDKLWDVVSEIAWGERVSVSSVVVDILEGRRPAVVVDEEPRLPVPPE